MGWYGFNGGSAGSIVSNSVTVSRVAVSTTLGGAAGGLSCLLFAVLVDKVWDVTMCLNGALAGLVSITSGCAFFEPWAAIVAGGVGGVLFPLFSRALTRLRVDDPLEARRRRLPPPTHPPRRPSFSSLHARRAPCTAAAACGASSLPACWER